MSVTVSTSFDGVAPPAAVPDLQTAIQAAYAFAKQAQAAQTATLQLQQQVENQLTLAESLVDQANGLLQLAAQKQIGLSIAGLMSVIAQLPTVLPATPGQLWIDGGVLSVS